MTKRTWEKVDKKGHTSLWEWEETPEVIAALEAYWKTLKDNESKTP